MSLSLGSLCSGIGLMDLGLEWAGLGPTLYQCEIDPFCRAVLAKHWPEAERYEDVRTIDTGVLPRVDLLAFGSPCQDLSSAGSRAGLGGPKSRIFYDCLRVVSETRPQWVVFENVASGASRWVDTVRRELEQLGYATLPIPVASSWLGAWQDRARVFIVAQLDLAADADGNGEPRFAVDAEVAAASAIACADRDPVRIESGGGSGANWRGSAESSEHCGERIASLAHTSRREGSGPGEQAARERDRPAADHWRSLRADMVRVVHGRTGRVYGTRPRIAALGNAPTPQQVEVVGHIVRELAGLGDVE